jgi:hypothetical protein
MCTIGDAVYAYASNAFDAVCKEEPKIKIKIDQRKILVPFLWFRSPSGERG